MGQLKTHWQIISIKKLSELAGVQYMKIRDTTAIDKPLYNSLTDNEKTQLANNLFIEMQKVFKDLGRKITIN
jgi:hypothetical protein